jgi:hypothetical protein
MSYKIIITEIVRETKTERKHVKTGQEQKMSSFGGDPYLADTYGYAEPIECVTEREVKRLEQEVEKIDIAAVIRAVNGL